jgi:hypothetical protein
MSDIVVQKNIGGYAVDVTSVWPQSSAAATINGGSIDRQAHSMALSCIMHTAVGAIGGAPTTASVQSTLQHAPDNATWTNYTNPSTNAVAQGAALTAADTEQNVAIDLTNAYRYIRVVTVVAFTGGTSPTALVNADLTLAGENTLAAV